MKKNKVKEPEEMHQHIDENKVPYGKLHPLNAKHKRKLTQELHDKSIEFSKRVIEKSHIKIEYGSLI